MEHILVKSYNDERFLKCFQDIKQKPISKIECDKMLEQWKENQRMWKTFCLNFKRK